MWESEDRLEVRKTLPYIRASGVERRPATQWPGRRAAEQAEARKRGTKAEVRCAENRRNKHHRSQAIPGSEGRSAPEAEREPWMATQHR